MSFSLFSCYSSKRKLVSAGGDQQHAAAEADYNEPKTIIDAPLNSSVSSLMMKLDSHSQSRRVEAGVHCVQFGV